MKIVKKLMLISSLVSVLLLSGCGNHGSIIASATNSNGTVNVYKSGTRYYYEYVIYDTKKEKNKVYESGKEDSLDDIAKKYNVVFD